MVSDWDEFLGLAGIINYHEQKLFRDVIKAENEVIRQETLKTVEARAARREQELKAATAQYYEYSNQFQSQATQYLAEKYEERMDEIYEEEQEALDELNEELLDGIREATKDEVTVDLLKNCGGKPQLTENMIEVYESDAALPLRAMMTVYPPGKKRVFNDTSWERFTNSVKKGWHAFVKWLKETGWRVLIEIGIQVILAFIPGIGPMLGTIVDMGVGYALDIIETAKTSAEKVALQRAMNEGRSRGLDSYEEMWMWRALIVILLIAVADANDLTIDGNQLFMFFRTDNNFMDNIKNEEFIKNMWACQAKIVESLGGEDPVTHEPDFQYTIEDVEMAREEALAMISDARIRGLIKDMPNKNVRLMRQCLS